MTEDISRKTFNKKKHRRKVIHQQGRVVLDADLNEQVDIQDYSDRTAFRDIIGDSGAPVGSDGFKIIIGASENGGGQKSFSYKIEKGRYYVDGILCENEKRVDAYNQPDLIAFPSFDSTSYNSNTDFEIPIDEGQYVAYLDVWERHLTGLDDPEMREAALGGPDTTTRTKVVWQVKLVKVSEGTDSTGEPCMSSVLKDRVSRPVGKLRVRLSSNETDGKGIYSGSENHLYRVEIHKGIKASEDMQKLSFKWSSDNATPETKLIDIDNLHKTLTVSTSVKDILSGFHKDQWLEVTDDRYELWGLPGIMATLIDAKPTDQGYLLTIELDSAEDPNSLTNENFKGYFNPKVRKWDGYVKGVDNGPVTTAANGQDTGHSSVYMKLKDGIEIQFDCEQNGYYQTGDIWLIAARTLTRAIEWPTDPNNQPDSLPPVNNDSDANSRHHYSPLALLTYGVKQSEEERREQEEASITWFNLIEDKDEDRGNLIRFLRQFGLSWDYDSSTVKKVNGSTILQISDSKNNKYFLDKRNDKIFLTTADGRLLYAFYFDDSTGKLLLPELSSVADCRQFFSPITLTPTTGIANLPLNGIKGRALLFGPFRHYLKVNVPPAIMLGLDSEELPRERIHFMEDFLRPEPSLYFKATFVDKMHFYISLEGSDVENLDPYLRKDLKLRWWAVPAQDKGEQTGDPVETENHTDKKMREWFASLKSEISTLKSGVSDRLHFLS